MIMKRKTCVLIFILVLFLVLSIPDFPIIPETIETAGAERVDTLKVEEELPNALADSEYQLLAWYVESGVAYSLYLDIVSYAYPAATYRDDSRYAYLSTKENISLDYRDRLVYFDFYLYFPAKFPGKIYVDSLHGILVTEDPAGNVRRRASWITDGYYTIPSDALDAEGNVILVFRIYVNGTEETPGYSYGHRVLLYYLRPSDGNLVLLAEETDFTQGLYGYIVNATMGADRIFFERDFITLYITADHEVREDEVLHHVTVPSYAYGANINVTNKPSSWRFLNITPSATVTEYSDRIEITNTIEGDYDVYFVSRDVWNYPSAELPQSRVNFFDQKGTLIPFDTFHTYYALPETGFLDDWFLETNEPDDDISDPDLGLGFAESFTDISDWTAWITGDPSYSFTTDGDIATMTLTAAADAANDVVRYWSSANNVNLAEFPFFEVRWSGYTNESTGIAISVDVVNSTGGKVYFSIISHSSSFDWTVERINLYELAQEEASDWSDWYLYKVYLVLNDAPDSAAQEAYLKVDWVRLYGFVDYQGEVWRYIDENSWVHSDGDVLTLAVNFDDAGTWEQIVLGGDVSVSTVDYPYLVVRAKGDTLKLSVYDGTWKLAFADYDVDDWKTYIIDVSEYGMITKIRLGCSDDEHGIPSLSGWNYAYFDYIAFVSEPSFQPLLTNIFEMPRYGVVWVYAEDRWGTEVVNETRTYSPFQDFTVTMYSFQVFNFQEDFIYVKVRKTN